MTKNRRRDRAINDIAQYLGIPHAFAARLNDSGAVRVESDQDGTYLLVGGEAGSRPDPDMVTPVYKAVIAGHRVKHWSVKGGARQLVSLAGMENFASWLSGSSTGRDLGPADDSWIEPEDDHVIPDRLQFDFDLAAGGQGNLWLGKGSTGSDVWLDPQQNAHLLLAGATASGKTVAAQGIIWSWLAQGGQCCV